MIACPACHRHIREPQCPFCGADAASLSTVTSTAPAKGSRHTLLALGVVALVSGCGESRDERAAPAYGVPCIDGDGGVCLPIDASVDAAIDAAADAASDAGNGSDAGDAGPG